MSGNNATLKIDFTDPKKEISCAIFFIYWIGNDTPAINKSLTYQFKQEVFQKQSSSVLNFFCEIHKKTLVLDSLSNKVAS